MMPACSWMSVLDLRVSANDEAQVRALGSRGGPPIGPALQRSPAVAPAAGRRPVLRALGFAKP